jgi:dTDP-L-rhamnose 4-epimerase
MEHDEANWEAINVGTGQPITVLEVAHLLSEHLGFNHPPEITQKYRVGDIRHCFADITKARELLGYEPKVSFAEGVKEVVTWVSQQTAKDRVEEAQGQLLRRNLIL